MTRQEFWEWLNTCPTHKHETHDMLTDNFGYVTVTFKVSEEDDNETIQEQ